METDDSKVLNKYYPIISNYPNEKIYKLFKLIKYNKRLHPQKRTLLLTNYCIYNIRDSNILISTLSLFNKHVKIKRELKLNKIKGIIYSLKSDELVLYVPEEFDYRLKMKLRDEFIISLFMALDFFKIETIKFSFVKAFDLSEFTTHNSEKKKGYIKKIDLEFKDYIKQDFIDFIISKDIKLKNKQVEIIHNFKNNKGISINNYRKIRIIGEGGFGRVYLVENLEEDHMLYAMKEIKKKVIIEKKYFSELKSEYDILHTTNHPFLINLIYSFQTQNKLYFIMPFVKGGDLQKYKSKKGKLSERQYV